MIRRATCKTWAKWFEKHEGVRISGDTIRNRLKEAGRVGEDGRDKLGRLFKKVYYSEMDIREACASVLQTMPQADESGFFLIQGVRNGTARAWSREHGISEITILHRLETAGIIPVKGKDFQNKLRLFFAEPAVSKTCADLLAPLPKADDSGFILVSGVRHGTVRAICRVLGLHDQAVKSRLKKSVFCPISGKSKNNRCVKFYVESVIRDLCADLLAPLPEANEPGFATINGVRHGTIYAFSRLLQISDITIKSRIRHSSLVPVRGRRTGGQLADFYPEPAARELCKDLIAKRKK